MHRPVEMVEVGARDGLQNEPELVPTETKIALIERMMDAGARRIEVASFVHPKWVPQMADAEAVVAGLPKRDDVTYVGLVLNKRGLLRALDSRDTGGGIDEVGCVAVASDGFGEKNQGMGWEASVDVVRDICRLAHAEDMAVQATISVAFGDPFDGAVPMARVVDMAKRIAEANPKELALGDTIGVAVPAQVTELFSRLREAIPHIPLRAHFHNTRNTGIANVWAAYQAGVSIIDASLGGLGGCPFAPKATGNVATEDVVYMLAQSGVDSGLDLDRLIGAARWFEGKIGKPLPSMLARAGGFPTGQ
ncbi:hydroxymethylglutaryl-CoA lyase [Iodidimonas muriae]|uniref:Hydroxymethylglutaryl-CoA lyase n=1 Tax=Iodidimonas muriae TaxID=261467 RepID=A0ABQ2L8R3_9PROT|nr:hydroxymethylglutaryl-CoA lyase [Iodidimonas muriae]GER05850.1 hydroxymethylglutaryl-CoA lyase [Kordiimonadales bacterium JCM 17843]GGO07131.1 hydroxymethylglutaryl-CoA lyase [Iodidimonas muriae]